MRYVVADIVVFAAVRLFENYFGVATTAHVSGRSDTVPKCVKKTWDSGTVRRKLCIYNSLHFGRVFAAEELWQ